MNLETFRASLAGDAPPEGISPALAGLWWDGKGDWQRAHACAQEQEDAAGAAVHAYLHRKEGDLGNAGYWYRWAGRRPATGDLGAEWEFLVRELSL